MILANNSGPRPPKKGYIMPEKKRQYALTYYRKHLKECRAKAREKYKEKRVQRLAYAKKYSSRPEVKERRRQRDHTPEGQARLRAKYERRKPGIAAECLKRRYGLTMEQYEQMLKAQGGGCAICGGKVNMKTRWKKCIKRLAVDHCHKTGKVRGLLCWMCNSSIGRMKDDPALLRKAADYVEKHQGRASISSA